MRAAHISPRRLDSVQNMEERSQCAVKKDAPMELSEEVSAFVMEQRSNLAVLRGAPNGDRGEASVVHMEQRG